MDVDILESLDLEHQVDLLLADETRTGGVDPRNVMAAWTYDTMLFGIVSERIRELDKRARARIWQHIAQAYRRVPYWYSQSTFYQVLLTEGCTELEADYLSQIVFKGLRLRHRLRCS